MKTPPAFDRRCIRRQQALAERAIVGWKIVRSSGVPASESIATSHPLAAPVSGLKGVGPRRARDLAAAGIHTVEDLLYRFPMRYEDRSNPTPIAALVAGSTAAVVGHVEACRLRYTRRRGFTIFEAAVADATGRVTAVWFNQRFLKDVLVAGQRVALFGKVEPNGRAGLRLTAPQHEILDTEDGAASTPGLHSGRFVPIYERAGTVTARVQRQLVAEALEGLPDSLDGLLPQGVRDARGWPPLGRALKDVHFPPIGADAALYNACRAPAQTRLVFEEFFAFQLGLALQRQDLSRMRKPHAVTVDDRIRASARAVLPFALTTGQREAVAEIVADMQREMPMNRLLQGDVGSGKTIVALLAALVAMENGLQVAFMAPTELLADQHAQTLRRLLAPTRFSVVLLTGQTSESDRRILRKGIAHGLVPLVVGTHALVQETVRFSKLGLVIIDEQHRFGVSQRFDLRQKGVVPDVLVMTATPIPRTLALTTYGDLDVSVIRGLPPGRTPVRTTLHPESKRTEVYAFVAEQIRAGRQAYVVFPLVEESDKVDLRAATEMADHLAQDVFPSCRVALLHGRLPSEGKERVMTAFAAGEIDILVATTVIEVGIDVPNATVIVIEHAERFGLAQLHQLRGRVGRGAQASYCLLLYQAPLSDEARLRLQAIKESTDGFVIADRDLAIRGPGDFFGTRQSGLPSLRLGDLIRDHRLMEEARQDAVGWLERASPSDPTVARVRRLWAARFGLASVG